MNDTPWWGGDESPLNEKAVDFIFALWGLSKAYDRQRAGSGNDLLGVVECAWWIGAAAEACGMRHAGGVLEGFYWVRNKGFHEIRVALGQIRPQQAGTPMGVGTLGVASLGGAGSPQRWLRLEGPEDGSRRHFNEHLAGRPTLDTVEEALGILLGIADELGKGSGLTDLPLFAEIFPEEGA